MKDLKHDAQSNIHYRRWISDAPKAALLLVHGLGGHTGRWSFLAEFFLKNNISSYAIELKGFGETPSLKGHIDSFDIYFEDILSLHGIIKNESPEKRVFLVGESMGALIAYLLAIRKPSLFSGLILLSPAFASSLKFSPIDYIKILAPLLYNPKREIPIPFDSAMCTRDRSYQNYMDADPREQRNATSKLLFNTLIAQLKAKILTGRFKTPSLFLAACEDKIVSPAATKKIFTALRIKDKTLIEYPQMYHALSIDLDRERVFEDMLRWLDKRI